MSHSLKHQHLRSPFSLLSVLFTVSSASESAIPGGGPPLSSLLIGKDNNKDKLLLDFTKWAKHDCGATGLENIYLGEFGLSGELSGERSSTIRGLGIAENVHIPINETILCMPQECLLPTSHNRFVLEKQKRERVYDVFDPEGECEGDFQAVSSVALE